MIPDSGLHIAQFRKGGEITVPSVRIPDSELRAHPPVLRKFRAPVPAPGEKPAGPLVFRRALIRQAVTFHPHADGKLIGEFHLVRGGKHRSGINVPRKGQRLSEYGVNDFRLLFQFPRRTGIRLIHHASRFIRAEDGFKHDLLRFRAEQPPRGGKRRQMFPMHSSHIKSPSKVF